MAADATQPENGSRAPLVSVVILNWNGAEIIPKALPAVMSMSYPNYEVIFVDNGSDDDSIDVAKKIAAQAGRELRIVETGANLGYNRGKNAGAERASGKYLWLLDNDIEPEPDALSILVDHMERHPRIGLTGPLLKNTDGSASEQGSGMFFLPGGIPLEVQKTRKGLGPTVPILVGASLGGSAFVRKSVWDYVGGYEPSSVFCMNDVDLGPRVWCAGFGVSMVPAAVVYHHAVTRSTSRRRRWGFVQYAPGVFRALVRNYRIVNLCAALPLFLVLLLMKTIKRTLLYRDPLLPFCLFPALGKALFQLPGSLKQRKRVQALRRVPEDRFLHPERYSFLLEETL